MGEMNNKVNGIKLDGSMGLIVFLICIFAGGWGPIVAGFLQKDEDVRKAAIIIGILQWLLAAVVVGWVWSIYSGYKIWSNSK